jgi:hypothetical protein
MPQAGFQRSMAAGLKTQPVSQKWLSEFFLKACNARRFSFVALKLLPLTIGKKRTS